MKKVVLGLMFLSVTLVGCASSEGGTTSSSLKSEVSQLKTENSELKNKVSAYEKILGVSDDENASSTSDSSSSSSNSSSSGEMKLNESAEFKSGEKITVTSIEEDPSLQLSDTSEGTHPVVVTATVENTTSSPLSFNAQSFDLYDGNSELAKFDASTYSNNIPHSIAGNKNATVVMHFAAKGNTPYSVTFGNGTWKQ